MRCMCSKACVPYVTTCVGMVLLVYKELVTGITTAWFSLSNPGASAKFVSGTQGYLG
jgi:hypothetical protein